MLGSCKISYSALVFAERQGVQLESFFESQNQPVEFLKDPTAWLPVDQLENFLSDLCEHVGACDSETYIREVGQAAFELRAWGVLDSVLKMVESPKDVFGQPDRFVSYFLSPHPSVKIFENEEHHIFFAMDLNTEAFPLLASYLMGAVEGLPVYMNQPVAQMSPKGPGLLLEWAQEQASLLSEDDKRVRQFDPEMVQSVMESLYDHQLSFEKQRQEQGVGSGSVPTAGMSSEDVEKMVRAEVEKRLQVWQDQKKSFEDTIFTIKNDFYKLYDYFTRAQQLITLISGTARKASVREAMRRVDWPYVQKEFPEMIEGTCDSILALKDSLLNLEEPGSLAPVAQADQRQLLDLNHFINEVIEDLAVEPGSLTIDTHWLLDQDVPVIPKDFEKALKDIFSVTLSKNRQGGEVRVMTRPNGRKAEIEITDTGAGFDLESLARLFTNGEDLNLLGSQEILNRHSGALKVTSRSGEGSTYLIELPFH